MPAAAITIDPGIEDADRWFLHAGTAIENGALVTAGGRVGAVVARGATARRARQHAYAGVDLVTFAGKTVRHDVGGET